LLDAAAIDTFVQLPGVEAAGAILRIEAERASGGAAMSNEAVNTTPAGPKVEMKLEVVVVPVSDVDRAKRFYLGMGWRLDGDFASGADWRVVQITPPGSACSFFIGTGLTRAAPGSMQGLLLMVDDIEAARAELVARDVEVSETFHFEGGLHFDGTRGRLPGPDPEGRSYFTFAAFDDPDGNGWVLQEIRTRLPGRGISSADVATLTGFLREAEERHGAYEASAPEHHWSDWYAGYLVARERGKTSDDAARDATQRMQGEHR
jgi:catechol 2,3-dioxygenase-like lactoylglutathione lyase family enzyme